MTARLPWRALLFDLDGTLCDTAPDLLAACRHALTAAGYPPGPVAAVRRRAGDGVRAMLSCALPHADQGTLAALSASMLGYYAAHICRHTRPYPGVEALVTTAAARGLPLGVVTGKPRHLAVALLSRFAFARHFQVLVGGDDTDRGKPAPEPLLAAVAQLGLPPAAVAYLGDQPGDTACARAAGCVAVAAAWGYGAAGTPPATWGADLIAACPQDLRARLAADREIC